MEEGCGAAKAGQSIMPIVTVARGGVKLHSSRAPRPSHHPPAVHHAALLVHSYGGLLWSADGEVQYLCLLHGWVVRCFKLKMDFSRAHLSSRGGTERTMGEGAYE